MIKVTVRCQGLSHASIPEHRSGLCSMTAMYPLCEICVHGMPSHLHDKRCRQAGKVYHHPQLGLSLPVLLQPDRHDL